MDIIIWIVLLNIAAIVVVFIILGYLLSDMRHINSKLNTLASEVISF